MAQSEQLKLLKHVKPMSNMGSITTHPLIVSSPKRNGSALYDYLHYIHASISYCIAAFFQVSIGPIADVLQQELNITSSGVGLIASSYFITYLLFQIPFGMILQNHSHHLLLLLMSIGLTICTFLFGFINSLIFGVIIRIITGIFAAPAWIVTITLISDHFGNNNIALFSGITFVSAYFTSFLCITIQGIIYQKYGIWREVYYILGLISAINVISIILTMYYQQKTKQNDISSLSWVNLFSEGRSRFDHDNINNQPSTSISESESIDSNTVYNKIILTLSNYLNWCLGIYGFVKYSIFTSIFGLWLIPYMMLQFNYSRSITSFLTGIATLAAGIGGFIFGCLATRFKKRKVVVIVTALMASVLLFLIYLDKTVLNEYIIFIIILISGSGFSSSPILFTLSNEYNTTKKCDSVASGFVNMLMIASGFVSQYITGLLIDFHWELNRKDYTGADAYQTTDTRQYTVADYQFAFSCLIPTCLIISFITAFMLKETNSLNI